MIPHAKLDEKVDAAVREAPVTDIHTHLYSAAFGNILLRGIDELLTYHYLVAEFFRFSFFDYQKFWKLNKTEQADLIWKTLFIENTPISEATRGVLTVLNTLGLDAGKRDLSAYRKYFAELTVEKHIDLIFEKSNVSKVIMTNDPFDPAEKQSWDNNVTRDPRFEAALRLDSLLITWHEAVPRLKEWGYAVTEELTESTYDAIKLFLHDQIKLMGAQYMAVSLPPTFRIPQDTYLSNIIQNCILPVSADADIPIALMIGVKKLVNPHLRTGGDSVGKVDLNSVDYLCKNYPHNKFLVTMLARENMHELCISARKFKNLMIFGCWWFLNNPTLIAEITNMRTELLGFSFIPQHSDARVLDQLVYKWEHSKKIIAGILKNKYKDIYESGWILSEEELKRDVRKLFSENFKTFLSA